MLRKRLVNAGFILVCIGLIISLIMNNIYSKRMAGEHQYTHILYNQFILDVYMAAPPQSNFPGFQRASVNMAYAASVLESLYVQASMMDNKNMAIAQKIQEDASFVSYLSLALVGKNETYLTGSGNKDLITITPNQTKHIVFKMRQLIMKNVVHGSDIPDDKIDAVYNGIHNLIPTDFEAFPVSPFMSLFH